MNDSILYKIIFLNRSKVYELYARDVFSSEIYGFIYVADLVFDQNKTLSNVLNTLSRQSE